MLGICSSVRCSVGINNIQISGMTFRLPFVCLSIRVDKARERENGIEGGGFSSHYCPPLNQLAIMPCSVAQLGARPSQGSSINHMSQRKEAGKKSESESVLGTCWRRLQLPDDYADYSHRRRRRRCRVLSIPLHNLHRSRQILIAHANHKLNLQSASRCAALRRCSPLSASPSLSTSLSPTLPLLSPLSLTLFVCARKYIMLNKLLCTVWGLHLAADE